MSKSMNDLVLEFPAQVKEAMTIASGFEGKLSRDFENVLICGLGGSGIGGTILSQLIGDGSPKPILSSKDYTIPGFVGPNSLVIICSYSGNTEETLEALDSAIEAKAQIACITSGGKLLKMAKMNNWPVIQIPSGYPPRSAFGYSLVQLFKFASSFGLTTIDWQVEVNSAIERLETELNDIQTRAKSLAAALVRKTPIIYSSNWLEGVGTRWRQQINENAKMLCWHHYYPEMNHNELVGWRTKDESRAVVMLKSNFDHKRVAKRMELSEKVYSEYTPNVYSIIAKGDTKIEQALYLIHLGDWTSVYMADLMEMDSTEVKVIDWLKGELSKF
ncbi:bifunctional phosphoglucose/phosphomannose isomerase [bacterium]|nr:bifunctional phosphoglucose/phosphomannose isomerase [bacterium]MDC1221674.1 bifunctional phosphoglucose/phosphomannose isomerase [Salibacteraceae bacterium]